MSLRKQLEIHEREVSRTGVLAQPAPNVLRARKPKRAGTTLQPTQVSFRKITNQQVRHPDIPGYHQAHRAAPR